MRTIKFRAWDGSKMIYPEIITSENDYEKRRFVAYDDGDVWLITHDSLGESKVELLISAVIMQFTGLLDKNGKEIYEGDIVIVHFDEDDFYCEVVLNIIYGTKFKRIGQVFFRGKPNQKFDKTDSVHFYRHSLEEIEVIGNIHQNPELLK